MPFTVHAPWKDWIFHIGLFHQWHLPCHGHTMVKKSKQGDQKSVLCVSQYLVLSAVSSRATHASEMMTENMMMSEPMMEMMNMMNMMKRYDDDE